MGRYNKHRYEDFNKFENDPDQRYSLAYKRMKRIKGFYVHLLVYLIFNTVIILVNSKGKILGNEHFWSWQNFSTALFWGIGLAAHGLSVFGRDIFFSKGWEERKIQELMEKQKHEKWE